MSQIQMEMVLYLLLYGACITIALATLIRRIKGRKTPFDIVIIACALLCIVLGAVLGIMVTA